MFKFKFGLFAAKDIGIDLGTANTLIYIKDKGIVVNEPSVIARDNKRGVTLAVGHEAKDMMGKSPAHIDVIRPLKDGVISDFDRAADMLKAFLDQAVTDNKLKNYRAVVGVPSGVTEVEKRAVEQIVRGMGATEVFVLDEPMAAAIGAGLDVDSSTACMIADIGGGTTDIAVISLGGIVASASVKMAGDKFDDAIIKYMRKVHKLYIGERTGEEIKKTIGTAYPREEAIVMECRGRDLVTGLPKTVEVSSEEIMEALEEALHTICEAVHSVLEQTPPELAADISNSGIVITGGGALLYGIDKRIEERTGIKVIIAENPKDCVAIGTGKALNELESLEGNALNRRAPYL